MNIHSLPQLNYVLILKSTESRFAQISPQKTRRTCPLFKLGLTALE